MQFPEVCFVTSFVLIGCGTLWENERSHPQEPQRLRAALLRGLPNEVPPRGHHRGGGVGAQARVPTHRQPLRDHVPGDRGGPGSRSPSGPAATTSTRWAVTGARRRSAATSRARGVSRNTANFTSSLGSLRTSSWSCSSGRAHRHSFCVLQIPRILLRQRFHCGIDNDRYHHHIHCILGYNGSKWKSWAGGRGGAWPPRLSGGLSVAWGGYTVERAKH